MAVNLQEITDAIPRVTSARTIIVPQGKTIDLQTLSRCHLIVVDFGSPSLTIGGKRSADPRCIALVAPGVDYSITSNETAASHLVLLEIEPPASRWWHRFCTVRPVREFDTRTWGDSGGVGFRRPWVDRMVRPWHIPGIEVSFVHLPGGESLGVWVDRGSHLIALPRYLTNEHSSRSVRVCLPGESLDLRPVQQLDLRQLYVVKLSV